jgi:hypothetical protein
MEEIKKVEEVTESPVTNVEVEPSSPVVETKSTYERQAMTRRQALGRLGFLAGAAAVAALGVDDLTRLVGKEMEKRAGDNKTARKVAQEFANAGVAFAHPSCGGPGCTTNCQSSAKFWCENCPWRPPCVVTRRQVRRPCSSSDNTGCREQLLIGVDNCVALSDPDCVKKRKCEFCKCADGLGDCYGSSTECDAQQKAECINQFNIGW